MRCILAFNELISFFRLLRVLSDAMNAIILETIIFMALCICTSLLVIEKVWTKNNRSAIPILSIDSNSCLFCSTTELAFSTICNCHFWRLFLHWFNLVYYFTRARISIRIRWIWILPFINRIGINIHVASNVSSCLWCSDRSNHFISVHMGLWNWIWAISCA